MNYYLRAAFGQLLLTIVFIALACLHRWLGASHWMVWLLPVTGSFFLMSLEFKGFLQSPSDKTHHAKNLEHYPTNDFGQRRDEDGEEGSASH